MEKFIPYEKLSKKEKRKLDQAKRQTWGELNPVTRKPENSRSYNRNKTRNWKRELHETNSGSFLFYCSTGRQKSRMAFRAVTSATVSGETPFSRAIFSITAGKISEVFRVRRTCFGGNTSLQ